MLDNIYTYMTTLLIIIGAAMFGLGIGLLSNSNKKPKKPRKAKTRRKRDKDLFFGTPLEKF